MAGETERDKCDIIISMIEKIGDDLNVSFFPVNLAK